MNVTAFYFGDIMIQDEIKSLEGEEWRYISGFEDMYAISNLGRLASHFKGKWRIRKVTNAKNDYLRVTLLSKGRKRKVSIHRLVAEAFVENHNGVNYVHHIDGNKQNNKASNLVWMSCREHHLLHMEKNPHLHDNLRYYNKYVKTKIIYQFSRDGKYIGSYLNGKDASDATGVCQRNILQVANMDIRNNKRAIYTAGGYIWSFDKEIDLEKWYAGYTL